MSGGRRLHWRRPSLRF